MTADDVTSIVEEKNRVVQENWKLRVMMRRLFRPRMTLSELAAKFPADAACVVTYMPRHGSRKPVRVKTTVANIVWDARPQTVTVLFAKPKCYMHNGDACYRPGVKVEIVQGG